MKFIRTMLGDIAPDELGVTDCHDHLIRSGGIEVREHKDFLMDSVSAGKYEFQDFLSNGGKSMVCCDPIGCGRDVPKMLEIAKSFKGQGNIIMVTGFHKGHFYDEKTSFLAVVPVDKVVEMCAKEITEGMDTYSYCGPVVERTTAKAGCVKAGTGYATINPFEMKGLEVAAKTSILTGCPIVVHTQLGTMAYEAAKILLNFGASKDKIALSHLNKNPDKYYYKKILDLGVFINFDGPDRVKYYPDCVLAENLKWLVDQDPKYASQILLAMDAGRAYYQKGYSIERGNKKALGLSYLLTHFVPLLEKIGIKKEYITNFLVENPKKWLTFDTPREI
ncbi:MAG: hypothetical protein RR201_02840 [Malacoplasma sp.]